MYEFKFPVSGDGRPIFKSNGMRVMFASGCSILVSLLEPDVLKEKFGAELIQDHVKLNPYFQIGECVGGIYRLSHFPLDGSECDYPGLHVFNVVPSEEYKQACKDPNIITAGSVCDIIVSIRLFAGFEKSWTTWSFNIPDDTTKAVEDANKVLWEMIEKSKR